MKITFRNKKILITRLLYLIIFLSIVYLYYMHFGDNIKLYVLNYDIEEKIQYMFNYYNKVAQDKMNSEDKNHLLNILTKLDFRELIYEETTLIAIEHFVLSVISAYYRRQQEEEKEAFLLVLKECTLLSEYEDYCIYFFKNITINKAVSWVRYFYDETRLKIELNIIAMGLTRAVYYISRFLPTNMRREFDNYVNRKSYYTAVELLWKLMNDAFYDPGTRIEHDGDNSWSAYLKYLWYKILTYFL